MQIRFMLAILLTAAAALAATVMSVSASDLSVRGWAFIAMVGLWITSGAITGRLLARLRPAPRAPDTKFR